MWRQIKVNEPQQSCCAMFRDNPEKDIAEEMVRKNQACDWPKFSGGHYKNKVPTACTRRFWQSVAARENSEVLVQRIASTK
jgi:hypothetical protein